MKYVQSKKNNKLEILISVDIPYIQKLMKITEKKQSYNVLHEKKN